MGSWVNFRALDGRGVHGRRRGRRAAARARDAVNIIGRGDDGGRQRARLDFARFGRPLRTAERAGRLGPPDRRAGFRVGDRHRGRRARRIGQRDGDTVREPPTGCRAGSRRWRRRCARTAPPAGGGPSGRTRTSLAGGVGGGGRAIGMDERRVVVARQVLDDGHRRALGRLGLPGGEFGRGVGTLGDRAMGRVRRRLAWGLGRRHLDPADQFAEADELRAGQRIAEPDPRACPKWHTPRPRPGPPAWSCRRWSTAR